MQSMHTYIRTYKHTHTHIRYNYQLKDNVLFTSKNGYSVMFLCSCLLNIVLGGGQGPESYSVCFTIRRCQPMFIL
jgi:hypothetical protein